VLTAVESTCSTVLCMKSMNQKKQSKSSACGHITNDKQNKKPLPDSATVEEMRKEYDFSKGKRNPYTKK